MDGGRVVSVNVAVVSVGPWTGRKGRSGIDKRPVPGPVAVGVDGVAGDTVCDTRHHGGPDQAVYAYDAADLAFWAVELGRPVTAGMVGENLTLADVDCTGVVVGERWRVGAAVLRVTGPRIPCRVFAGFLDVPDLVKRFTTAGRPGAYLAVDRPGVVAVGDRIEILHRPAHGVSVAQVAAAMSGRRELVEHVATARADLRIRARTWLDGVRGGPRTAGRPPGAVESGEAAALPPGAAPARMGP